MPRDRLAEDRAQRPQPAVELTNLSNQEQHQPTTFLAEVSSILDGIQQLDRDITQLSELHAQQFNTIDTGGEVEESSVINLTAQMRALSQSLRDRIQRLNSIPLEHDAQMRRDRIAHLRSRFQETLQKYQQVEQESRARMRERVERQFKIVKPDATPQEVRDVVEGGQQVFTQALLSSSRYGESRAVYQQVQARQYELQRIEQTLAELGQLFADMGTLVEQQDSVITSVDNTATDVEANTRKGLEHVEQAVVHARSARRKRWICFWLCVFVVVVLAAVLGGVFGTRANK